MTISVIICLVYLNLKIFDFSGSDYVAGLNLATESYEGGLEHFQIPCYVSNVEDNPDHSKSIPYKY